MFDFIASIFGYLLYGIYNIIGDYGITIIIFTILTKLIVLPLTVKQHKSLEENKKIQPLLQELQLKYKDDQQKMAEEYQKLMKDTKFNPFSGCLISLLQIPILFGLLFAVSKPLTNIVKMPAEQIKKEIISIIPEEYEGDYDQYVNENRYAEIEVVKQKEIFKLDFLGINLGDVASQNRENLTLYILPILTAFVTWMSVYTINGNKPKEKQVVKDADGNEIEMPNMQLMNIMMPVMSGYIAYIVPQALALYWFVSSILQIIIQITLRKILNKEEK